MFAKIETRGERFVKRLGTALYRPFLLTLVRVAVCASKRDIKEIEERDGTKIPARVQGLDMPCLELQLSPSACFGWAGQAM
jgi:hypothetical protein